MFRFAQHDKITPMEIVPLGDSALIVRVRDQFEDAPEETLDEVLRTFQRIRNAAIPGVIELAPAYTSVSVFFDPITVTKAIEAPDKLFDWVVKRIRAAVAGGVDPGWTARSPSRTIEIPVCYDSEFAPDLDHVAEHAKISPIDVVDLHRTGEYRAACIGFVPGFPFLSGLARKLATPRRDVPRKEIPPGSVGIGGAQTGIYPLRSPGGWNLIGRTPLKLFDPTTDPPALLRAGDHVRFRAITREEFEALKQSKGHPDPAAAGTGPHTQSSGSAGEPV
ncbi:MAG: kinase inhibitor [Verrucomicrobia bacterium]|nr:MAG: kinase inhibitor [Verrucomicrobiota bacterium]